MPLSTQQLDKALDMRVSGKSYTDIAAELGLPNSESLRYQIREYQKDASAVMTGNLELTVALDLARIEIMVPENLTQAIAGSYKHVDAMIKLMRARMDVMKFLMELQKQQEESGDVFVSTIDTNSEEYLIAAHNISDAFLDALDEEEVDPTLDLAALSDDEREQLETQLTDLDITLATYGKT